MTHTHKWSLKFDQCIKCHRRDYRHVARGLCSHCYENERNETLRIGRAKHQHGSVSKLLTHDYLNEQYVIKKKSLEDIAKDCNCTRQYVYKMLMKYGVSSRTLKDARELAFHSHKIKFIRIDEIGNEHVLTLDKGYTNEHFFSSWSDEMAYVLGVVYTDGNIDPGSKLDPSRKTTLKTPRLTVGQKEAELLNKLLKLMDCNSRLLHRKKHGTSGDMFYFHVHSWEIYDHLIKLGLSPDKSRTVNFPQMPEQFVRHFIRGCWDGDGSVYIDGRGKFRASYISGSSRFVETLRDELYKAGIHKRRPPSDRIEAKITWSDHPDGKFPVKIHKDNRVEAYYVRVDGTDNLERLFHFLYDEVDESMYLTRKYDMFVEGLRLEEKRKSKQLSLDIPDS